MLRSEIDSNMKKWNKPKGKKCIVNKIELHMLYKEKN